ncbi:N-acetylmuramate alpha-1-phosphate uridylyltransferase MurU [Marinobacter sp.]|uniref:N-acetylmuramate alpha-1-phosphate uridylyltransferase MurU n=1 Tax=Marinobacter sp. TaxID=50741 RepID=UPI00384E459F
MKAMILAAGKGERMRPLTLTTPKPLLRAGGRSLLGHHLEHLRAAGLKQIVVNHSWLGEQIEQALGDGRDMGLSIVYSPEPEPLETAGGIRQALPLLTGAGSDWFLVINGDIWSDFDPAELAAPADPVARALLVLVENPPHHPEGDFYLAADGSVHPEGPARKTFAGISLLHRSLFANLEPGHRRLAPILTAAMGRGEVRGLLHSGAWFDIGTPARLAELDRFLQTQGGG